MNYKLTLALVLLLSAILPTTQVKKKYANLYEAARKESPKFAELIRRSPSLKKELSGDYFGSLLIPAPKAFESLLLANDDAQIEAIVRYHMLPKTDLLVPKKTNRVVKTDLKGTEVRIYRSPYGKHPMRVYYRNNTEYASVIEKDIPIAVKKSHGALINKVMLPDDKFGEVIPGINAKDICKAFDYLPCEKLGLVEAAINVAASSMGSCKVPPAGNQTVKPTVGLKPLKDARPLPASFSLSEIASEGPSYYWIYRMIRNLESYAVCESQPANNGQKFQPPHGWTVLKTIPLPQEGSSISRMMFTAIMLSEDKKHLVFLNRGTMSAFEWNRDFAYNRSMVAENLIPETTHYGISSIFKIMWENGVKVAIDDFILDKGVVKYVTIGGHSLGGGVGTLMAYATQEYLNKNNHSDIVVDALLFAPPNVGPPAFVNSFNKLVNARRVIFEYDVVGSVPCSPNMFSCSKSLFGWPIKTNMPGDVKSWGYANVAGTILLESKSMPHDDSTWAKLSTVPLNLNAGHFIASTHVCSYLCYFSQYSGSSATASSECWLSKQPSNAAGSQCFGFPVHHYP